MNINSGSFPRSDIVGGRGAKPSCKCGFYFRAHSDAGCSRFGNGFDTSPRACTHSKRILDRRGGCASGLQVGDDGRDAGMGKMACRGFGGESATCNRRGHMAKTRTPPDLQGISISARYVMSVAKKTWEASQTRALPPRQRGWATRRDSNLVYYKTIAQREIGNIWKGIRK